MVTSGAADSHVATAEFLQVADREVEDFEGGLPGGELAAVAGDLAQPGFIDSRVRRVDRIADLGREGQERGELGPVRPTQT